MDRHLRGAQQILFFIIFIAGLLANEARAAYIARRVESVVILTGDGASDTLNIDTIGGFLRHNRFSAGDPNFASDLDWDTTTVREQKLTGGDVTQIFINAGAGDDLITFGNDTVPARDIGATFNVNGEAGDDSLAIDDNGAIEPGTYIVTGASILADVGLQVDYSGLGTERIDLFASPFADKINVIGTGDNSVGIEAGAGDDVITFGNLDGMLADLNGFVTVAGDDGSDTIIVNDAANPDPNTIHVNSTSVSVVDLFDIGFNSTTEFLVVNGGLGDDTLQVQSTSSAPLPTINGGDGNDTISIGNGGNSLDDLQGPMTVNSGAGSADSVIINDAGDPDNNVYTITATTVSRAGAALISYTAQSDQLIVNAGTGNDVVTVTSTAIATSLNGNEGNDGFTLADGKTLLGGTINGGAGADTLDYSQFTTSVTVNLLAGAATGMAVVSNLENVTGGSANDTLTGDTGNNLLIGGPGDDTLSGGDGNDTLIGGLGNDGLSGDGGDDNLTWNDSDGNDVIEGGPGNDTLVIQGAAAGDQFVISPNGARARLDRNNLAAFSLDFGTVEQLAVNGNEGDDTFTITPLADTTITIDGGAHVNSDTVTFILTGVTNPQVTSGGPATFGNRQSVNYPGVEVVQPLASLSGQKFNDLNGDGVKDAGEPGLPGWTLFLDKNGSGTLEAGDSSTTTDASGNYSFGNLLPDTYRAREVVESGWVQTTANRDVVLAGSNVADVNFGNFQRLAISGQVFQDTNNNGAKDDGEPGQQGWAVQLIDANTSAVLATMTTDNGGNYSFANLGPGRYRLREIVQAGWTQSTAAPADISAVSGTSVANVNFGNAQGGGVLTLSNVAVTSPINEGGAATLSGAINDPDTLDTFVLAVNWGDGSATENFNLPSGTPSFSVTHQYTEDNPTGTPADIYSIQVTLTDDDGGTTSASASATINNLAPVLSNVAVTSPITVNTTATLTGNIQDVGVLDTFTIVVDWKDGSASQNLNLPVGATSFNLTHDYTLAGTFQIGVLVTDDDSGSASANASVTVNSLVRPPIPSVPDLPATSDTGPADTDNVTSVTTPTFQGTALANSTVELFANGVLVGTGAADGSGNYAIAASVLVEGTHAITARIKDAAGLYSDFSVAMSPALKIDTTAPAAPSMPDLYFNSDSGASDTDNVTGVTLPTFQSGAELKSAVQLIVNGSPAGSSGVDSIGDSFITLATALTPGTHQITAQAVDAAGNVSPFSPALSVTIDIPPAVLTIKRDGTRSVIAWPSLLAGVALEGKNNLDAASAWTPVLIPHILAGDQRSVTVEASGEMKIYRLRIR